MRLNIGLLIPEWPPAQTNDKSSSVKVKALKMSERGFEMMREPSGKRYVSGHGWAPVTVQGPGDSAWSLSGLPE